MQAFSARPRGIDDFVYRGEEIAAKNTELNHAACWAAAGSIQKKCEQKAGCQNDVMRTGAHQIARSEIREGQENEQSEPFLFKSK